MRKNLLQVCYTDKFESEKIIVQNVSTEERELESVHKSINTNEEKYEIYKTEDEEPFITDNPVIKYLRYFYLFDCGKNILNRIDPTFK